MPVILSFFLMLLGPVATLSPGPDGDALQAEFRLDEPVEEWRFAPYDTPQRADGWSPAGEGWRFDGQALRREDGEAFSAFTLRLLPDPGFHDRRYVSVDRVGQGWVVYPAAFAGTGEPVSLRFTGFPEEDVLFVPGSGPGASPEEGIATHGDDERIAYIGPPQNIREGDVTLIHGPELPAWIADAVQQDAGRVVTVLTRRLGRALENPPTIILTYDPDADGSSWKGGAFDGAAFTMRLKGAYGEADEDAGRRLAGFAAHETVHLWNGGIWKPRDNDSQPWLHEGTAEYIADRLMLQGEAFRTKMENHLSGCMQRLGDKALDGSTGQVYGQTPYDCGVAIQLAAEVSSLNNGGGDIFELWSRAFARAGEDEYTPEDFLAIAGEAGGEGFDSFADLLLHRQGQLRWLAIGEAFHDIGLSLDSHMPGEGDGPALRDQALMAFLGDICTGSHGWYSNPGYLKLETGERCGGVLAGDPDVATVNGASLTDAPYDAYLAIRKACSSGGALVFAAPEGGQLAPVACSLDMTDPPQTMILSGLANLPAPEDGR